MRPLLLLSSLSTPLSVVEGIEVWRAMSSSRLPFVRSLHASSSIDLRNSSSSLASILTTRPLPLIARTERKVRVQDALRFGKKATKRPRQ